MRLAEAVLPGAVPSPWGFLVCWVPAQHPQPHVSLGLWHGLGEAAVVLSELVGGSSSGHVHPHEVCSRPALAACSFSHRLLGAATCAWPVKRGPGGGEGA